MYHNKDKSSGDQVQGNSKKKQTYIPKRIKCENCEKQFNKNETYQKHVKKMHDSILGSKSN